MVMRKWERKPAPPPSTNKNARGKALSKQSSCTAIREAVLDLLGGRCCHVDCDGTVCGITKYDMLTVEHKFGGGADQSAKFKNESAKMRYIYSEVKGGSNDYQAMCMNHNFEKARRLGEFTPNKRHFFDATEMRALIEEKKQHIHKYGPYTKRKRKRNEDISNRGQRLCGSSSDTESATDNELSLPGISPPDEREALVSPPVKP